ncbi:MAG: hypothetical protein ABIP68_00305 [Ferruginibacter sp.]
MNNSNRELMVLFNQTLRTQKDIEFEVSSIHHLLCKTEKLDNIAHAFEIIDLSKYKIRTKHHYIKHYMRMRMDKPFIFLFNKN